MRPAFWAGTSATQRPRWRRPGCKISWTARAPRPPSPGQPRWVVGRGVALAAPGHVLVWVASCKYCRLPPVLHAN